MRTYVRGTNAYDRFKRALETADLATVLEAATEVPHLQLSDALEVLVLMARDEDPRFERAAARWVGRLLVECRLGLRDARYAIVLAERLPNGREALRRLTQNR
jgi:hypothetical protein